MEVEALRGKAWRHQAQWLAGSQQLCGTAQLHTSSKKQGDAALKGSTGSSRPARVLQRSETRAQSDLNGSPLLNGCECSATGKTGMDTTFPAALCQSAQDQGCCLPQAGYVLRVSGT